MSHDRTSAKPQVNLSLLHSNSLKLQPQYLHVQPACSRFQKHSVFPTLVPCHRKKFCWGFVDPEVVKPISGRRSRTWPPIVSMEPPWKGSSIDISHSLIRGHGDNFSHSVNNTGDKFNAGISDTGDRWKSVTRINRRYRWHRWTDYRWCCWHRW
jgi:hypothetical protein